MKQFSSDIRYVEATPRKQRKKSGAYSVISAGVSSSADNSALKSYVDSNFMSLATGQDVSALHNFLNGFNIAGIPFRKTANGQLFIDASVVFGGGVTMYGTDTTPAPSIFDGLPIDNETIYWDGDVLKAMGGGGGGVADSVAWANVYGKPTWITNTKPTYNYGEIQGTPDLSIYALASSLANYALKTSIPTNNNQLTNGAGYITASALNGYATQSWVNTALTGYATEAWVASQGYITQSALSPYFLISSFTKANIKSTLGISDWALASATPTIKKERLTNLDSGNPWTAFYTSFRPSNRPDGANYFTGFTLTNVDYQGEDDTYKIQLAISHTGTLHTRYRSGGSFRAWNTLAFTSNIPTKLSQLTDDVVAGKYLPITGGTIKGSITAASFIGNLTGNANSATKLATPRTIWGQSFDGTENISHGFRSLYADSYNGGVAHSILNNQGSPYGLLTRIFRNGSVSFQAQREANDAECFNLLLNHLGGNVAIGGITADAKLHVYGNIKTSGFVIADTRMYSYGYLMTNTGLSYCGLVQNSLVSSVGDSRDIWLYNEYMTNICGRTGVSIDGASAGVTIKGNLLTTGGITMYSQRSLKNILSYDGLSLEQLSVIKPIKFTWKDGRDNRYHVGGVADDMATVVPEVVYSANDFLTMDYGNAGFYVAASLIKPVIDHEQRIQQLEQENKALRDEINQLKQAA